MKLTRPQAAQLARIAAGGRDGMPAAGYTGSAAEVRLERLGLIRHWALDVPLGVGGLVTKLRLAEPTPAGHAALTGPLQAPDLAFLARGEGVCTLADDAYRVALARGHVRPAAEFAGSVVWQRTPAGTDALARGSSATPSPGRAGASSAASRGPGGRPRAR